MTIWEWLTALLRRWPILLAGILCTMGAVVLVHGRPIAYEACGSVVVSAPKTLTYPNIYNNLRGSLVAATGLIVQELTSAPVQRHLMSEGLAPSYQAEVHNTGTVETPGYTEPLMDVCTSSYDSGLALRTSNAVIREFGTILRTRQASAHVPRKSLLTDTVIVKPGAQPVTGRPSQAYLGVGLMGLIITGVVALWSDQLVRRRKRLRKLRRAARGSV